MFADWLQVELGRRGMSQADLEAKSGLSAATISRILSGSRGAGADTARKIARAFNMPPENVMRAAGILPPTFAEIIDSNPSLRELYSILSQMSEADQVELLRYARYRLKSARDEQRGEA